MVNRVLFRPVWAFVLASGLWFGSAEASAPREYSYIDVPAVLHVRACVRAGDPYYMQAVATLRAEAEKALLETLPPVTEKTVIPPGGDVHDYYSLSPYWWPDPARPDGLPYVRRDGLVNPERETIRDRDALRSLYKTVETLTLAFVLTDDEGYGRQAASLLSVWLLHPDTRMNPSLTYAQVVKGNRKPRGAGIIEGRGMPVLVACLELLERHGGVAETTADSIRQWFRSYLAWLEHSPQGVDESDAPNNHGTWYEVQRASIALVLGDTAKARTVIQGVRDRLIASQIEPDGRQPLELVRTRALHYTTFNLMALFAAASLGDRVGLDLWNHVTSDGRGLRRALDWLQPYATGQQAWTHQQIAPYDPDFFFEILLRASRMYVHPPYREAALRMKGVDPERHRGVLLHPR